MDIVVGSVGHGGRASGKLGELLEQEYALLAGVRVDVVFLQDELSSMRAAIHHCCRRLPVMQLGGDRQRTRRAQGHTTLHSVSHARTLWISTEHEIVALPNVAAFSVMLFAIYSRCLHGLRPTITPPRALALLRARLMHNVAVTTLAAP
jgi:hypothetical protein